MNLLNHNNLTIFERDGRSDMVRYGWPIWTFMGFWNDYFSKMGINFMNNNISCIFEHNSRSKIVRYKSGSYGDSLGFGITVLRR